MKDTGPQRQHNLVIQVNINATRLRTQLQVFLGRIMKYDFSFIQLPIISLSSGTQMSHSKSYIKSKSQLKQNKTTQ